MHDQIRQLVQPRRAIAEPLEHLVGAIALLLRHSPRSIETVDRGERDLSLLRILARSLTQRLGRLFDIENVVDDLKREAHVLTVAGERGVVLVARARIDRAEPETGPQEGAGLGAVNGLEQL